MGRGYLVYEHKVSEHLDSIHGILVRIEAHGLVVNQIPVVTKYPRFDMGISAIEPESPLVDLSIVVFVDG